MATAVYIWRARKTYGSIPLLLLALAAAQWALCFGLEVAGVDFTTKVFWARAQWLGLTLAPVLWLATAAHASGAGPILLSRGRWLLWLLVPLFMLLLAWTNDWHHLIWSEVGPSLALTDAPLQIGRGIFFWLNAFFAVGICLLVTLLAMAAVIRLPMFRRRYAAAVLAGTLLPWVGNTLYLAGLDLAAPLCYWLGGLTLSWGLYQIQQLNLVPVARSAIVDSMPDGVLVLDNTDRVLDCNLAATQLLGKDLSHVIGRPITEVLQTRLDLIERYSTQPHVLDEIILNGRICELRIVPMSDRLGRPTGRLIMARDITERIRSADELDQRTAELQSILQAFPDFMFRLDEKGYYLGYTASPQAHLYLSAHQILGRRVDEVLPAPVGQQLLDALQQVRSQNAPQALDYTLSADGSTHWYEARLFPTRRQEVIGVVRDVTEQRQAESELREQKELLENLVTVARATSEQPAMEATLENVMRVGLNLTAAERGSLFLLNGALEVAQTLSVRDDAPAAERRAVVERLMHEGLVGWVVRERQAAVIKDTRTDERWLPLPNETVRHGSALALPILSEQTLLGVLILTHSQSDHFTAAHSRLMEAAADQMALAVRNARLYDLQRHMAERQTTLYEVLRAVSGQLDAAVIAQTAVEAITHFAGWPHVALLLADNDNRHWIVQAVSGAPSLPLGFKLPIAPEVRPPGISTEQQQGTAEVQGLIELAARAPTAAHLVVPLWHGGSLIGILNIEGTATAAFDADDLSLAQSLADAVALALDNARLYETINDERSRLQASIRFNRDGIVLLGMSQRILVINAPALRLLALPDEPEDWLNRSVIEVLTRLRRRSPTVVKTMIAEIKRTPRGDEPPAEGEYEVNARMIHWSSLPVLSHAQPIGRLIVLRDVTEEHQLNAMREDLTNTMVHDLRNPTTVVLGALDLFDGEPLTESQSEIASVARQGAQRLLNLVNAILDVNRLESGQMPMEREPVRVDIVMAEVVELEQVLARDKQQTLQNCVPADLPLVSVDLELLRRVIQNLIGNALKFTPPHGTITIGAQRDPGDDHWIRVSIHDTGPGIPPDVQPRLFQKFVAGRVRGRGSGLGLAFCRLVVEAHGGHIWAESTAGNGALFHFTLPVADN